MPLVLRYTLVFRDVKIWGEKCFRINEIWYIFQRTISQVTKVAKDEPEEGIKYLHLGQLCTLAS